MNIYVDKFPESCECCPCNDDYYRCGLSGDLFDLHCIYKRRMKNCKLKQLADVVEVVRCHDCKFAEVADANDSEDGYICQFHRGSIWFSGSYCSFGERKEV